MGASGNQGEDYTIDQSCRFDSDTPAYLARTFDTPTNNKIWTLSFWSKICRRDSGGVSIFFGAGDYNGDYNAFYVTPDLKWDDYQSSSWKTQLRTNAVYRDPAAWYHIVWSYDSTPSTPSSSSIKIFVNGEQLTSFSTETYPSQNQASIINTAVANWIGNVPVNGATYYFDGYMAEVVFVDGTALDADSFGKTNSTTGQWIPKEISGLTFGNNGFHLDFADSTFLGKDARTSGDQVNSYASSQWGGSTGSYSFSDGRIEATADNKAIKSDDTFTGDFEFQWQYKDKANWVIGVYETGEDGTFDDSSSIGGMNSMTDSWYIQASSVSANNDIKYGGATVVDSTTIANGDTWNISRSSGTLKIERNGSTIHTWAATSTNTVRMVFAQGDTAADAEAINWVDNSTLGNNFFSSGLATTDQRNDTPTSNRATFTPLSIGPNQNLSDGNLKLTAPSGTTGSWNIVLTTMGVTQKTYWEVVSDEYSNTGFGLYGPGNPMGGGLNNPAGSYGVAVTNTEQWVTGSAANESDAVITFGIATDDVVNIAFDPARGAVWYGIDGTWKDGTASSASSATILTEIEGTGTDYAIFTGLSTSVTWIPGLGTYSNNTATLRASEADQATDLPSGYIALDPSETDDPTIADPSAYFQTTLYTGDGSTQSIDQGGNSTFSPNFVWIKNRSAADDNCLFDTARGATKLLISNDSDVETTDADTLTAFDSDGFSLGDDDKVNTNTESYVGWQWLESATPGFDLVTYEGNATNRTISHSLGAVPELMIVRRHDAVENWGVYHGSNTSDPATEALILDLSNATNPNVTTVWNDTAPTSSVFTVGTGGMTNSSGGNYIAYLWAGVESFSKFGKYTGNGSTDGPFNWCGFRPAWLMIKRTDGTGEWYIMDDQRDTYNVMDHYLRADTTNAEGVDATSISVDFLSNGFKMRYGSGSTNGDGETFVFIAFADTPFKTANAR